MVDLLNTNKFTGGTIDMVKDIKETMEDLGYTNIEGMESFQLQVGELEIEEGSPLYQKIKKVYGDKTMETFLITSDCYGDDKNGNRVLLFQMTDEQGNLFFAGSQEKFNQISTK